MAKQLHAVIAGYRFEPELRVLFEELTEVRNNMQMINGMGNTDLQAAADFGIKAFHIPHPGFIVVNNRYAALIQLLSGCGQQYLSGIGLKSGILAHALAFQCGGSP